MRTESKYYLWLEEKAQGPFTLAQLRTMWGSGRINLHTLYAVDGVENWSLVAELIGVLEPAAELLPQIPKISRAAEAPKRKSGPLATGCALLTGLAGVLMLIGGLGTWLSPHAGFEVDSVLKGGFWTPCRRVAAASIGLLKPLFNHMFCVPLLLKPPCLL